MELYQLQIIESVGVALFYLLFTTLSSKVISRVARKFEYQKSRTKVIKKLTNIILSVVCVAVLLIIWGVKQSDLLFFVSSFLTILGVAFFAQWSVLSNITSTIILFFNHPVRIGDRISVLEKDNQIEGEIVDIGMFFIYIKADDGEQISMPSNLFMQKAIKKH